MEGLYEEAKTQHNKALTIYKAKRGEESSEDGCVYNNLGLVADEQEDYEAVNQCAHDLFDRSQLTYLLFAAFFTTQFLRCTECQTPSNDAQPLQLCVGDPNLVLVRRVLLLCV